jgi:hypothetical protein
VPATPIRRASGTISSAARTTSRGIAWFFDGFTLVEPGLVAPAQWRPDLENPLRQRSERDGDDEPVLRLVVPEPPEGDPGIAWHLCGIGIKDQP